MQYEKYDYEKQEWSPALHPPLRSPTEQGREAGPASLRDQRLLEWWV